MAVASPRRVSHRETAVDRCTRPLRRATAVHRAPAGLGDMRPVTLLLATATPPTIEGAFELPVPLRTPFESHVIHDGSTFGATIATGLLRIARIKAWMSPLLCVFRPIADRVVNGCSSPSRARSSRHSHSPRRARVLRRSRRPPRVLARQPLPHRLRVVAITSHGRGSTAPASSSP